MDNLTNKTEKSDPNPEIKKDVITGNNDQTDKNTTDFVSVDDRSNENNVTDSSSAKKKFLILINSMDNLTDNTEKLNLNPETSSDGIADNNDQTGKNTACSGSKDDKCTGSEDDKCTGSDSADSFPEYKTITIDLLESNDYVYTKFGVINSSKNRKYVYKITIYYTTRIVISKWYSLIKKFNENLLNGVIAITVKKKLNDDAEVEKRFKDLSRIEFYCEDIYEKGETDKSFDVAALYRNIGASDKDYLNLIIQNVVKNTRQELIRA